MVLCVELYYLYFITFVTCVLYLGVYVEFSDSRQFP